MRTHLSDRRETSCLSAKSPNHVWRKDSCIALALGSSRRGPLPGAPGRGLSLTPQKATTSVTLCWQDPCSGGGPVHTTAQLQITTQAGIGALKRWVTCALKYAVSSNL